MSNENQNVALTADEIFGSTDLDTREFVPLPEWGTIEVDDGAGGKKKTPKGLFCRVLSMKERGKVRKEATSTIKDPRANGGMRDVVDAEKFEVLLLIACAVNAEGRKVFSATDEENLMGRRSGTVSKFAKVAMKLAGLDPSQEIDVPS